jgi:AraC-like DNA-binding protein
MGEAPEAYCFFQEFGAEPERSFRFDRHYLLYASAGHLRLRAGGRQWTLPPARAALIAAGHEVAVALPGRVTACSVLWAPGFAAAPPQPLAVIEMPPVARELALACRGHGSGDGPLDAHDRALFQALAQVVLRLAATPSPTSMPAPSHPALARALALTEAALDAPPAFPALARAVGLSERALTRLFAAEAGMTWRAALRRLRLIRAVELLADGHGTVTEVALAVGYDSLSAFNAAFRDFAGCTPTAYRASFR